MMANPDPANFNELLAAPDQQLLIEEDATEYESEYEDEEEESTVYEDEEEDDEEEEEGGEELVSVAESLPPRVSDVRQTSVGEGEKRRRVDGGVESCSASGIESGESSHGSKWNQGDIDGLFCPICMDVWTNTGDHHIRSLFLHFISTPYST